MSEPLNPQARPAGKPLGVRPRIYLGCAVALAVWSAVVVTDDNRGLQALLYSLSAACLVGSLPFRTARSQGIQRVATILTYPVVTTVLFLLGWWDYTR